LTPSPVTLVGPAAAGRATGLCAGAAFFGALAVWLAARVANPNTIIANKSFFMISFRPKTLLLQPDV